MRHHESRKVKKKVRHFNIRPLPYFDANVMKLFSSLLAGVLAMALAGCVLDSSDSTSTSSHVAVTPTPEPTSVPTAAPTPTPVPTPTATPTPVVTLYTVGGTVSGLTGGTLILQNNGADALTVTANGTFTFATGITLGSSYNVTVGTQPAGLICKVSGASGSNVVADVATIAISCAQTIKLAPTTAFASLGYVLVDPAGNVYTCEVFGGHVYKIAPGSTTATAIPGLTLNICGGMALDASGNLYIADGNTTVVWKIALGSNTSTAVTINQSFSTISDIAIDAAGALYVVDENASSIYKIPAGSSTATLVTNSVTGAALVTLDASGNLYVTTLGAGVYKVPAGGTSATLIPGSTSIANAWKTAVDAAGNIFVAGSTDHLVYKIAAGTNTITHVATGSFSLGIPTGVALDSAGNLYVADLNPTGLYEIGTP